MNHIEINASNEYHILRHFESVSDSYKASLVNKEYFYHNAGKDKFEQEIITSDKIEAALNTKGSKFFKDIPGIATPIDVLKIVKTEFEKISYEEQNWEGNLTKKFFSFLINYDYPVGLKNLVNIKDLTKEERSRIKKVTRGSHSGDDTVLINTVENVSTKKINTIEVCLVDTVELPFYFITAFPGDLEEAPDFPNSNQSTKDFVLSTQYWDSHVFIM